MTTGQQSAKAGVDTVPRQPFAHLNAPNAPLYRDVLSAFTREQSSCCRLPVVGLLGVQRPFVVDRAVHATEAQS